MVSKDNPINKHYEGLGEDGYLMPTTGSVSGMMRFIERAVPTENPDVIKKVRILQQYQWDGETYDWYDIPLVEHGIDA